MSPDAELTESYRIWYSRHVLLASVGADFEYREEYKEGDIVTDDCRGITLRFPYTEAGTDRCFYALLKAEDQYYYEESSLFGGSILPFSGGAGYYFIRFRVMEGGSYYGYFTVK